MTVTPLASRTTSPRCAAGCSRAARSAIASSGTSNSIATAVAARTFARLPRPTSGVVSSTAPRGVVDARARAVDAAIDDRSARARRRRGRCRTSRRGRRTHDVRAAIRVVVGVGDEHRRRRRRLRESPPWRRRWRRREPKKPRCASPTLVQTRTSGSAMRTSVLISPAWFMPSSTTAIVRPLPSAR